MFIVCFSFQVSELKEKVEQKETQLRDLTEIAQNSDRNDTQELMRIEYEYPFCFSVCLRVNVLCPRK